MKKNNAFCYILYSFSAMILIFTILICFNKSIKNVFAPKTEYEVQITKHIENINTINNNASVFLNNSTIYTSKIKSDLPKIVDKLSKEKTSIAKLKPDDKYIASQSDLLNGLNNNINIYSQIIGIINNPYGNDINKALNNLKSYKSECNNYYKKINIKSECPTLTQNGSNLVQNTISYTNTLLNSKSVIKNSDNDYENDIREINSDVEGLMEYHYSYIEKVRAKNMAYDDVLKIIETEKETLYSINKDFISLSVPEYYENISIQIKKTIDDLNLYLTEIDSAVKKEKSMADTKNFDKKKADELYNKSKELYNSADSDYKVFSDEIKDLSK